MFENLQDRLGSILNGLTGRGALSEADVSAALREVRRALLEADVALDVVRGFTDRVREKAIGAEVLKSIKPGQMVVKIVHDELIEMLGADSVGVDLNAPAPVVIMMVDLQGSGKTTTSAKIAHRLTTRDRKKVLMASLDTRRPAAQEQLRQLGVQASIDVLPIIAGQSPTDIAARAVQAARLGGHDVVILDTAGRTHIDEPLMVEMAEIKRKSNPHEILLVADSLTGQDAVNLARNFDERVGITGLVLTRMDGDGRGGAALSMRAVTGKPIKLIGTGEKWASWKSSIRAASPTAFSAWATSSRSSSVPPRISTPRRRLPWPPRWPRASLTSTTSPTSCARCRRWAAWAASWE